MLAFVTSVRHPRNSHDYDRVELLLRQTLASVTAQTDEDFVVIVVGNQRPSFELPDRVEFVEVGFEPPAGLPGGPPADRAGVRRDKGRKFAIGLIAAREHRPDFVMLFDADDFVHRGIVAHTKQHPDARGWVIDRGWIYSRSRNAYRPLDEFNWKCGTSFVVPFAAYGVPEDLDVTATEEQLRDGFGERMDAIVSTHHGEPWFRANGYDLESFPWRASVYHVDTGENRSGKQLLGFARPLSAGMRRDFSIPGDRGALSTLWRSLGPEAAWQSLRPVLGRVRRRLRARRAAGA